MSRTEFLIPATLDAADGLTRRLADGARACLPPDRLAGLEIAVAEALNNVVLHGYGAAGATATIGAALAIRGDAVAVEIRDTGRPVPPGAFAAAGSPGEIDPLVESGRGLALIAGLPDRLDYASDPDGNRLTLEFDRPETGA